MKFFFDLFPVVLFFLTFKFYGDWVGPESSLCLAGLCIEGGEAGAIYAATVVAILSSVVQVGWFWLRHRRFETMHLVTLALLVVLGGATIAFHNEAFIKWKPTLVNWLFAVVFLGSHFIGNKPLVQRMMENAVTLENPEVWKRLSLAWISFFLGVGLLNLYVAFNFETSVWVNFKLFGLMGLTLVFVVLQALYLTRHMVPEEKQEG
jgi:intracellular septation protein